MPVPIGNEVYNADAPPVVARGSIYTQAERDDAFKEPVPSLMNDDAGHDAMRALCDGLALSGFGKEAIAQVLDTEPAEEHERGWREGEALAEAWLSDHRECAFPWPLRRDLRHRRASLPGAELVGFAGTEAVRFAFAQVKTSKENKSPPRVMTEPTQGLVAQVRELRDAKTAKSTLVKYLAARAVAGAAWADKFRRAAERYFNSGRLDFAVFGVLVRDVVPNKDDLSSAASALAIGCPATTTVELRALYLPVGCIPAGPQHRPRRRRNTP